MNAPFITIDLHGLMQAKAKKAIDHALSSAGPGVYQLRLVHGYHGGMSLRSMSQDEYRCHEKVLRIQPDDNPGVTADGIMTKMGM